MSHNSSVRRHGDRRRCMMVDSRSRSIYAQVRCCSGKNRYQTKKKAKEKAERNAIEYGGKYNPYRCDICGGWHIKTRKGGTDGNHPEP